MENVKIDFTSFVVSLATGAAGALNEVEVLRSGKTTGADGEQKDVSPEEAKQQSATALEAARHLIDTMALLEEKIEKQHLLNFIYGMGAGIVIYHFMIGALLILGIIWFYNFSLKNRH